MNRGFTLLELMGVIALLGILALIAIPAIDRTLNSSKEKLSVTQEKQIIKGAKDYYAEHLGELPNDGETGRKTLEELKADGYLPYGNPEDSLGYSDASYVEIKKENGKYVYNFIPVTQESTDETDLESGE